MRSLLCWLHFVSQIWLLMNFQDIQFFKQRLSVRLSIFLQKELMQISRPSVCGCSQIWRRMVTKKNFEKQKTHETKKTHSLWLFFSLYLFIYLLFLFSNLESCRSSVRSVQLFRVLVPMINETDFELVSQSIEPLRNLLNDGMWKITIELIFDLNYGFRFF